MKKTIYYWPSDNHNVIDFYVKIMLDSLKQLDYEIAYVNLNQIYSLKRDSIILILEPLKLFKLYIKGYRNFIVWFQGLTPEESFMKHKSKLRWYILSKIELFAIKKCIACAFVSNYMVEFYAFKYKLNKNYLKSKSHIMPCYNCELDISQFKQSRYDSNVFCYVGSMAKWQYFDETVKFYKKIEDEFNEKVFLKVLTNEVDKALPILKSNAIKHYSIKSVIPEKLSDELSDCKFGFILRENNPVNNVATPTKLLNYISNGIIPIISDCIYEYSTMMKNREFFIMINNLMDINIVKNYILSSINNNDVLQDYTEFYHKYYNKDEHILRFKELFIKCLK